MSDILADNAKACGGNYFGFWIEKLRSTDYRATR